MSKALITKELQKSCKLTKTVVKQVIEYYDNYQESYELPKDKLDKQGNLTTEMITVTNGIPTLTDLADKIGVSRWTVYKWWERVPEFVQLIEGLTKRLIEDLVVNSALKGHFNPQFAKFYLENKYNYNKEHGEIVPKAPSIIFQTQINHFLAQQGVPPIKLDQKDELPAFTEPEDID